MTKPLVTVLVVTYNHINTFEKAIKSVLEQKTNFDFEIWVLDDCSTDGTSNLVKEYANRYPDKIKPIIREENLGGIQNVFQELKNIRTKYYATLESDDYWCDENKLQQQVNILEKNPDCSFCSHNSYRRYPNNENCSKHNTPYIKTKVKTGKFKFPNKINRKQYIEPHYSSRMYRTECLHLELVNNPVMVCYDIASVFWFLQFGNMYYDESIMSVYNFSYNGVYSGADSKTQNYMSANIINQINEAFNYKYNSMFLDFFKSKIHISLFKTFYIKYLAKKKDLSVIYNQILDSYINAKPVNSKILFSIRIPLPKRKRLYFEIRREREM